MFRVMVQHAVEMVPVAGPILSFGFDVIDAVHAEVQESRPLSREQIMALVRQLDQAEIDRTVDDVLQSGANTTVLDPLTRAELLRLRRQLAEMPSELGRSLDAARHRDRRRAEEERDERVRQRGVLDAAIAERIRAEDWAGARRSLDQRLRLGGAGRDVRRAERYVYRKEDWRRPAAAVMGFVGLFGFLPLIVISVESGTAVAFLLFAGIIGLALGVLLAGRFLNRAPRLLLLLVPVAAVMGLIFAMK
jgi:hypothetical protein